VGCEPVFQVGADLVVDVVGLAAEMEPKDHVGTHALSRDPNRFGNRPAIGEARPYSCEWQCGDEVRH
jgi:hypothetical protein